MIAICLLFEISPEHVVKKDYSIDGKFMIHSHDARRAGQHWDLRLGYGGGLESWACRKLPDLIEEKTKKILLIRQPTHDPDWFDFTGEITDGYGAGKVSIWDKGNYDLIKWTSGIITVNFHGTKLKGIYHIKAWNFQKDHWLMFRGKD